MRSSLVTLLLAVAACGGSATPRPSVSPAILAAAAEEPRPPVAAVRPHAVWSPHGTRNDPYYWLRDDTRKDPEVLAHLNAEKAYAARAMAPAAGLTETLFRELRGRLQEADRDVPTLDRGYWYYTRYETGKQHPIYARRKGTMQAAEEVLLDGNQLAEGHAFYRIETYDVSASGRFLAWTDDVVGRNQFVLHVKDLGTGEVLPDTASNVGYQVVWADDKTLFYVSKDAITLREDRIFRHTLGSTAYEQIFHEADGSYYVSVGRTKSRRYVRISLESTTTSEHRLIDARRPDAEPVVFLPRTRDVKYDIDHLDGVFWMRTNDSAKNYRLVRVEEGKQADREAWKDVIAYDPDVLVSNFVVADGFVAATVHSGGLPKVKVIPSGRPAFFVDADDPTYAMRAIDTPDPSSPALRFSYTSMVSPERTFEVDATTGNRTLLKETPVPGYDPTLYTSEYLHAPASDGTLVPISVVYKKSTRRDGSAPLLVFGYGSYGATIDARMSSFAVSLLDRGWVYAIAHVRGGQEMGRHWYESGKLMNKKNTFTDFIAATEYLANAGYGARDQIFARGGSAGGMLMGAVLNMRPDLYRGVVAHVPFVDVVTTMLDESLPLTTNEFDEWGNPKERAAYDYMLSYSPYDNVVAQDYPSVLVQTGLWDSQVQYFEPAKWVAKLRATHTDDNLVILDIDMSSGHGGASGRFDNLRQSARVLAFLLHVSKRPDRRGHWPR